MSVTEGIPGSGYASGAEAEEASHKQVELDAAITQCNNEVGLILCSAEIFGHPRCRRDAKPILAQSMP